ncbi:MAG: DUF2141 domain-containing protein [Lautropia sp.]
MQTNGTRTPVLPARIAASIAALALVATGTAARGADLEITVTNVLPKQGELMVALYDRPDNFPHRQTPAEPAQRLAASGESARLVFNGLAPGRWAVVVLQDLNGNGRVDTNLFGMPIEPYGASNNQLPRFSAPTFDAALVEVGPGGASIRIDLRRP